MQTTIEKSGIIVCDLDKSKAPVPLTEEPGTPPIANEQRSRRGIESLAQDNRSGVVNQTGRLDAKSFGRYLDATISALENDTVPPELIERTLAWLIVEAETGLNISFDKHPVAIGSVREDWAGNAPLLDIAKDLKAASEPVLSQVKPHPHAKEDSSQSRLLDALDRGIKGWHESGRSHLETEGKRQRSFHSDRNSGGLRRLLGEALVCTIEGELPVNVLSDLHIAVERSIEGIGVLVHEPAIDETLVALAEAPDSAYSKWKNPEKEAESLRRFRDDVSYHDGLAEGLNPLEIIAIQCRYLGDGAPPIEKVRELVTEQPLLLSAFSKHGLPSSEELVSWKSSSATSQWIQHHMDCSPDVAQACIEGALHNAVCRSDQEDTTVIHLHPHSKIQDVLEILGYDINLSTPLALDGNKLPSSLLSYLTSSCSDVSCVYFRSPPTKRWITAVETLLDIDAQEFEHTFEGYGEAWEFLGGGFISKARNEICWEPGRERRLWTLQVLVDPETRLSSKELLGNEHAQSLVERLGGPACETLLRDGVGLTIAQWGRLASQVHGLGTCNMERRVHRFRVELGFLEQDDSRTEIITSNLDSNEGRESFLAWCATAYRPDGNRQIELLERVAQNPVAARSLTKLRAFLPELADLGESKSIEILEAVHDSMEGNGEHLVQLLTEQDSREKITPLRLVLYSCLDERAKGLLLGLLKPESGMAPSLESVSLDELTEGANSWLTLMGFDQLTRERFVTTSADLKVGTVRHRNSLSAVEEQAEELLSRLVNEFKTSATNASVSGKGRLNSEQLKIQRTKEEVRRAGQMVKDERALSSLREVVLDDSVTRASASDHEIFLTDSDTAQVVFHEVGHHVEYSVPGLYETCVAFRQKRARSTEPVPLRQLVPNANYREDEIAYEGDYISPYVGKLYKDDKATEVYAMGLQHFTNSEDMASFASKDHEHFLLTLGTILRCRGEI